jgi:hypothetical protein
MGRKNLIWLGGLVLANLLVLAGIAQVWFGQREARRGARARDQLALPQAKPLRSKEALDSFNVVVAKDLFSQDRSGAEMSAGAGKGQGLEDGLLLGTIIVGDEKAVLIGQTGAKGKQKIQVLRQGEQWRGFRLVEIAKDEVIFQGKEGKRSLTFPRPKLGQ